VREQYDQDQEGEISFHYSHPPLIPEEKGMTLLESHHRLKQVCEQDREAENLKHTAGTVGESEHNSEE